MKGTFFAKPLEFKIEISGESWKQGELIRGKLCVTNHGDTPAALSNLGAVLAFGDSKKIKSKDQKSFKCIDKIIFEENDLPINESATLRWQFKLDENAPISETKGSLYIICGDSERPFDVGQLQLNIIPCENLTNLIEVFKLFFKFKVKAIKNKKGSLEVKMLPPGSKDMGIIEQLLLSMNMSNNGIELRYKFIVKKIDYADSVMNVKSENIEIEQTLTPTQFKIYGDAPNQDGMREAISQTLDQIRKSSII